MKISLMAAVAVPLMAFFTTLTPGPADATTASAKARTCHWNVVRVHDHHVLYVRSGPGRHYRKVGRLKHDAKRVPGACHRTRTGWVHVHRPKGWANGHFLKKAR